MAIESSLIYPLRMVGIIYLYLYPHDIPIFVAQITIFFACGFSVFISQPLASLSPGECRGCRHFRGFWDAINAALFGILLQDGV